MEENNQNSAGSINTPTGMGLKDVSQSLSDSDVDLSPKGDVKKVGRVWGRNPFKIPKGVKTGSPESVDLKIIKADIQAIKDALLESKRVKKIKKGTTVGNQPSAAKSDGLVSSFFKGVDDHLDPISADVVDAGKWLFKKMTGKMTPKEANTRAREMKKTGGSSSSGELGEMKDRLVKLDLRLEDDVAGINKKLDLILEKTDGLGGSSLDGIGGLITRIISGAMAGLSAMMSGMWGAIKSIAKFLGVGIGAAIKKITKKGAVVAGGAGAATVARKAAMKAAEKKAGKAAAKKAALKAATVGVGKMGLKAGLKAVPLVGLAAGLGFGAYKLAKGDFTGAALEVGSGAASLIPGVGTAASIGLSGASIIRDVKKDTDKAKLDLNRQNDVETQADDLLNRSVAMVPPARVDQNLNKAMKEQKEFKTAPSHTHSVVQPIVINKKEKTRVVQQPSGSNRPAIVRTRNDEKSLNSTVVGLYDAPQGYNTLSRL